MNRNHFFAIICINCASQLFMQNLPHTIKKKWSVISTLKTRKTSQLEVGLAETSKREREREREIERETHIHRT